MPIFKGVPWGASYDPWILPPLRTFTLAAGDIIADGTWRNLNLAEMVGARNIAVKMLVIVNAAAANRRIRIRGPRDGADALVGISQVANVDSFAIGDVGVDGGSIIQYNADNVAFALIAIRLLGVHKGPVVRG